MTEPLLYSMVLVNFTLFSSSIYKENPSFIEKCDFNNLLCAILISLHAELLNEKANSVNNIGYFNLTSLLPVNAAITRLSRGLPC